MKFLLIIINFFALIGAIIWCITVFDWESTITSITLFGTLLAQIFTNSELKSGIKFTQKSGEKSYNYQSGENQIITDSKKIQKGGKGAYLIQADKMHIHAGITEKRAREICQEMYLQVRKDYSQEAMQIATSRIIEFENRLMPKMEAVSGALEAFADPSFQLLLIEAQKIAASTERPSDYDLLSELLIHRFQKGENRISRAGINFAIEIVDKVSDDALLALTVSHAISTFTPVSGDVYKGLDVLNDLFGKLLYNSLPIGDSWLDHLDVLNAVRLNSFGGLKTIQQYYPERLSGYIDIGLEKESTNFNKAIELLNDVKLPHTLLVPNPFNENYLRLDIPNKQDVDSLNIIKYSKTGDVLIPLTSKQKDAINSIYTLYKQDEHIKNENINKFMEEWNKRQNLKILKEWWDKIGISFQITSVGKVLAHSNAQRCDKNLPSLDN